MSGRNSFEKIKWFIRILVFINSLLPKRLNRILFTFFRFTSGKMGLLIRYIILKNTAKKCGDNVSIHPGVYLFNANNISFGNNISIHPMCYVEGIGGLTIGNNVSIAHATSLLTTNHAWDDAQVPIKYNPEIKNAVEIADDVWIGCGARILAGVKIGTRSVVAAGAVVSKNVNNNSLVGGIPAKLIKNI